MHHPETNPHFHRPRIEDGSPIHPEAKDDWHVPSTMPPAGPHGRPLRRVRLPEDQHGLPPRTVASQEGNRDQSPHPVALPEGHHGPAHDSTVPPEGPHGLPPHSTLLPEEQHSSPFYPSKFHPHQHEKAKPSRQRSHDGQTQQLDGSTHHQDRPRQMQGLIVPVQRQTNPLIWFTAVFCAIFWLVIIVGGLIVLIIYLVFRPKSPRFEVSTATLNAAYLDMGYLLNSDMTLLANFSNPNQKVSVDFSYNIINLYYGETLVSTQYIEPFSAAKLESKFANIHMVSSQVRLPIVEAQRLAKQMESNSVVFDVRGFFRARSNFGGLLRYSYWLYSHCRLELGGSPSGVLVSSKCRTKR